MNVDDFWPRRMTTEELRHRERRESADQRARERLIDEHFGGHYTQLMLEVLTTMSQRKVALTEEIVHRIPGGELRVMFDNQARRTLVEMRRAVYGLTDEVIEPDVDTWEQDVPWHAMVAVAVPNGFWRRLRRRPEKIVWGEANGTVKASGRVSVRAERKFVFPDLDPSLYPPEFGRPVITHHYDWTPRPHLDARTTRIETPGVTEARR